VQLRDIVGRQDSQATKANANDCDVAETGFLTIGSGSRSANAANVVARL
jgi:hypothetical protein